MVGAPMSTEVVMPQMGESIAEGTITKWLKKIGEHVERDEPLFEISTDKVAAEIPSPAAGTLSEVRFKEGDTVEVNSVVAVLDGGSIDPNAGSATRPEKEKEEAQEPEQPPQSAPPVAISGPAAPAKSEFERAESTPKAPPVMTRTNTAETPAVKPPTVSQVQPGDSQATAEDLRRTKSSPLVRRIAEEHGVDIAKLEGTGLNGRVTKNDILSFIESGSQPASTGAKVQTTRPIATFATPETAAPSPVKPAEGDRVEQMTLMRRKIAEHMVQSRRTSAHVTTVYEIDMTRIAKLREQHKDSFAERTGTKL